MSDKVFYSNSTVEKPPVKEPLIFNGEGFFNTKGMQHWSDGSVTIDSYIVPHIKLGLGKNEDGEALLSISQDSRFGYFFSTVEDASQAIILAANAMAIISDLSSFGKHCRPINSLFSQRPENLTLFDDED